MKRASTFLLSMVLATVLAACGSVPTDAGTGTNQTSTAAIGTTAVTSAVTSAAPSAAVTTGGGGAGSGGTIKIVSSLPRQGSSKGQTDAVVNAIKLRLKEANNQVCGGQFTIQYEDKDDATAAAGKWDSATETANAQAAAADTDVMVYIGTFNSGAAKLSMPILNQAGLVMISPANTNAGLTKPGKGAADEPNKYFPSGKRNYTRVVTADDIQGAGAANFAANLGAKSAVILDDQETYGVGLADVFAATAKTLNINVIDRQGIDGKASDYRSLATKILSQKPDLVYFGGIVDNNAGQLLKDLRAVGYKGFFMGADGIQTDSMIQGSGAENAEGIYATIPGLPDDQLGPQGKGYLDKYKAEYGQAPESYGIFGYDAAGAALQALNKACKKDRAAVRDAVFAIKDFDGALGKWSFDENGDTTLQTIVGYQVKGGKWVPAKFFGNGQVTDIAAK